MSNLRLALLGVHHIGSFDGVVEGIDPEDILRLGIKVDGLHSLFVVYYVHFFPGVHVVSPELGPVGEQHDNIVVLDSAYTAVSVRQLEALSTGTRVRAIQIGADVRALMLIGLALVDIHAMLAVILRDYVAGIAGANVATVGDVVALMRATAAIGRRAVETVIWKHNTVRFESRFRFLCDTIERGNAKIENSRHPNSSDRSPQSSARSQSLERSIHFLFAQVYSEIMSHG